MGNLNMVKRTCGFYVSSIHLITMILPYIKRKIENETKIETLFEYNLKQSVINTISNIIISEEEKEKILNINWNRNKTHKYFNMERRLKDIFENNDKINIIVSGSRKYIEETNQILNKFLNKNINKYTKKDVMVITLYEVTEFDDNIREILDKNEFILNTSGIHKIDDVFEDYKKEKIN